MAAKLRYWLIVSLIGLLCLTCRPFCESPLRAYAQHQPQQQQQPRPQLRPPASIGRQLSDVQPARDYNKVRPYDTPKTSYQNKSNNQQQLESEHDAIEKCSRESVILARQMIAHELNHINQFNAMWFSDLDRDELIESQKHSLSKIVMSGASTSLLNPNGMPLIDIESSYFRQHNNHNHQHNNYQPYQNSAKPAQASTSSPIALRLLRRHQDKCQLKQGVFSYSVGLSIGPIEHHLDVVYNLPRDLQLSQPTDWRYGHITIVVPRMHYEVGFKQAANYKLDSSTPARVSWGARSFRGLGSRGEQGCPLAVSDVTYVATVGNSYAQSSARSHKQLGPGQTQSSISITSFGLAVNNQTRLQIERLFDDYTRPAVSQRLRQMIRFYLNSKTFPLWVASN